MYITCKSLYKDTKDKCTKEITQKKKIQKIKFKIQKKKMLKINSKKLEKENIRRQAAGDLQKLQLQIFVKGLIKEVENWNLSTNQYC